LQTCFAVAEALGISEKSQVVFVVRVIEQGGTSYFLSLGFSASATASRAVDFNLAGRHVGGILIEAER
jgi:hypothetical protein